ncbi:MAG: hypothetical protein QOK33_3444 [Mycobacterium sp.]|nr:hypothetical protein [Mycobacterium sp.]
MTPPIIVSTAPECASYRSAGDAVAAGSVVGARIFDADGRRLEPDGAGGLRVAAQARDGADELATTLRNWLGHMDALRESTANWSLALLVRVAVDRLGYTA